MAASVSPASLPTPLNPGNGTLSLEAIDKPLCDAQVASFDLGPSTSRRFSRLPPAATVPVDFLADSSGPQKYFYVAVRTGHRAGVYVDWKEAELQLIDHPYPVYRTFSTRFAAEAFVAGWQGAGRHSLPGSSPRPLREHLAMNFPNSVPLPSSSNRPSYHSRLLCSYLPTPGQVSATYTLEFGAARHSVVRVSSPLRCQIDEDWPKVRKSASFMGRGGLLSPPDSPIDSSRPPPLQGPRLSDRTPLPSLPAPLLSPPNSPKLSVRPVSGLWADTKPATPSSLGTSQPAKPEFEFKSDAPKFSRSGLRSAGVVMPVSAPRPAPRGTLGSLKNKTSVSSLRNGSSSSVNSTTSDTVRRPRQDRLASLAETSKRELQLNKEGLLALEALSPPRPSFLRTSSSSSVSSVSSAASSYSTTPTTVSRGDSVIAEEAEDDCDPLPISCTKSDGDGGSVESSSLKSKKGGGLFKRLSKALKLEKKDAPGQESGRRGSIA